LEWAGHGVRTDGERKNSKEVTGRHSKKETEKKRQ
jgi:hypothetical protein